jgi:hypothetical protein
MMVPAWPKRIICGQGWVKLRNVGQLAFATTNFDDVFGQRRNQPKMFRDAWHARALNLSF